MDLRGEIKQGVIGRWVLHMGSNLRHDLNRVNTAVLRAGGAGAEGASEEMDEGPKGLPDGFTGVHVCDEGGSWRRSIRGGGSKVCCEAGLLGDGTVAARGIE